MLSDTFNISTTKKSIYITFDDTDLIIETVNKGQLRTDRDKVRAEEALIYLFDIMINHLADERLISSHNEEALSVSLERRKRQAIASLVLGLPLACSQANANLSRIIEFAKILPTD